jgi:cytosine/adenosine deaminase-related metal-dependent hydrolase
MAYRKFYAETIFTGNEYAPEDTVLVTDDSGEIIELVNRQQAGDDIQHLEGLLTPGFVNTHCHLELSHMKGKLAQGTGLVEFLVRVIKERGASDKTIADAMAAAEEEMYACGIVAVGDTCNTAVTAEMKTRSRLKWRNFVEVIGFTEMQANKRLDDAEQTLQIFLNYNQPSTSLTPHAPYSVSKGLFEIINKRSANQRISIHNQESMDEDDLYRHGSGGMFNLYRNLSINPSFFMAPGTSSLEAFLPLLDKASGLILVHNTYITETDIRNALKARSSQDLFFCACPSANRYIENALPPIELLRDQQATIVLGTDSYASNWRLNIFEEVKLLKSAFPHISLAEMLQWATVNGAKALEMDQQIGSFEKGKKPGLVLIKGINGDSIAEEATASRIL